MRDLDGWVRDSVFEANLNIVKYIVIVSLVEWSRTWAFLQPLSWTAEAFRVIAWAGLLAVVTVRLLLYYGVEREIQRAASEHSTNAGAS